MQWLLDEICQACEAPERFIVEAENVPDILSDPQLLRVILSNLADNALKYSEPESAIFIRLDRAETDGSSMVRLAIENGAGAAGLPDAGKLFDKYYRSPHAYGKTGSGLGLYLVRGFAELLGRRFEYQGLADSARFTLLLPCG